MPNHHKSLQAQVKHRHRLAQRASISPKTIHKKIRPRDFPKGLRQIPIDNLTNGFDIRLEPQVSQQTSPTTGIMDLHGASPYSDCGHTIDKQAYAPILPMSGDQIKGPGTWNSSSNGYELSGIPDVYVDFTQEIPPTQATHIMAESSGGDVLWGTSGHNWGFGASINCWPPFSSPDGYLHMGPMQIGEPVLAHWGQNPSFNSGHFPLNDHNTFMQNLCDGYDDLAGGTMAYDDSSHEFGFGAPDSLPHSITQLWSPATNVLLNAPAFFFS